MPSSALRASTCARATGRRRGRPCPLETAVASRARRRTCRRSAGTSGDREAGVREVLRLVREVLRVEDDLADPVLARELVDVRLDELLVVERRLVDVDVRGVLPRRRPDGARQWIRPSGRATRTRRRSCRRCRRRRRRRRSPRPPGPGRRLRSAPGPGRQPCVLDLRPLVEVEAAPLELVGARAVQLLHDQPRCRASTAGCSAHDRGVLDVGVLGRAVPDHQEAVLGIFGDRQAAVVGDLDVRQLERGGVLLAEEARHVVAGCRDADQVSSGSLWSAVSSAIHDCTSR
jgi:hypothetical protein